MSDAHHALGPARTDDDVQRAGAPVSSRWITTALGDYLLAATDDALIGVWRRDQKHFPAAAPRGDAAGPDAARILEEAAQQLTDYLSGARTDVDLPLAPDGTAFQQDVWAHLRTVPRGSTTTYGQIAAALGRPRAAQAVGAAVGANPLSIVVPCHRVVGTDGSLTGYAGGLETKTALLRLEGAID